MKPLCFCIAISAICAACSSVNKDAGFVDVSRITTEQTGLVIQWQVDTNDDRAVAAAVRQMLSHDLTADEAAQIALLNNHHLQAAFEDLGIAQADLVQAGLLKNPVFDLGVRFPDRAPAGTYLDIGVGEDFLDVVLLSARKKLAAAEFGAAKARVASEVLSLAAETRSDFYACQAAEQLADLSRSVAAADEASLDTTRKLHDAGNLSDLDFATQRALETRAKIDLADAEATATEAREKLSEQMGLPDTDAWKVAGRVAEVPDAGIRIDSLESLAVRQRQDLASARQDIIVQARTLGLTADYRFFSDVNVGPEFEHETDGQWRIGPTVSLPIPLFDQGEAKIARAAGMYRQARQRYLALESDVRSQVRIAASRLINAKTKAILYRDQILPDQRELLDQTQLQYNGMFVGVFQLLEARRDQIDANRQYIESLRDYWIARARLEEAVGGRLAVSPPSTQTSKENSQ